MNLRTKKLFRAIAVATAATGFILSSAAYAAGLGRITVTTSLGQPLNAEIELVSLQPGEFEAVTAKVASPESYQNARIDYQGALRQLRFATERKSNGQPIIRVTSVAPINEPFLDVLIEMTWPSGRLQREYPILLDPPGFAEARIQAPAAAVAVSPAATSTPTPTAVPSTKPSTKTTAPVASSGAPGDTYGPVKRGDTLAKIVQGVKPSGVTTEQMLAAMYRDNKAAFAGNMNRLKVGQVLRVPSAEAVGAIAQAEAVREIRVQASNFNNYRKTLASNVAAEPAQKPAAAGGKIAGATPQKPAPTGAAQSDTLKISKSDAKGAKQGDSAARVAALQEEATAREKALKEANERVAQLEKQVSDMKKVVELKNAPPAVKPAETKPAPVVVPPPVKVEPPKPEVKVEAPKVEPPKLEVAKVDVVKPVEQPKPPEVKVAEAPKPVEAVKPVEQPKPVEVPKPKVEAPKPKAVIPPPSSGISEYLPYIGAGVAGLVGLGGLAFWSRRRKRAADDVGPVSNLTSAFPSDLKETTVTGKTAGGLVDTGNSSFLTDFDKTGPGTIDTDEVDPVAEAEVYIAYGRDAQAEEILKEAWSRDKKRSEIPLKLLEIYHSRKAAPAFESVARELHSTVGDNNPTWAKAAAMGAQIDPANPLYSAAVAATGAFAAGPTDSMSKKPDLDFDLGVENALSDKPSSAGLDFDLGSTAAVPTIATSAAASSLDFDLGLDTKVDTKAPAKPGMVSLDLGVAKADDKASFDFDLSGLDAPKADAKPKSGESTVVMKAPDFSNEPMMDFERTFATKPKPADIPTLDLAPTGGDSDAAATKIELAKAYVEIGDKDGAKEILAEVLREGGAAQKAEAEALMKSL